MPLTLPLNNVLIFIRKAGGMGDYNAGTVEKYRGKWRGVIGYTEGGKRKRRTRVFADIPCEEGSNRGKAAALKALAEWRAGLVAEGGERGTASRDASTPLGAFLVEYAEGCKVHAEPRTVYTYMSDIKRLVAPHAIAAVPIGGLTPMDVRAWLADLSEDYEASTVSKAFVLVRSALRQAVNDGRLLRNPTDGVKAPKRPEPRPNAITEAQRPRLAAALADAGTSPEMVGIRLAFYTGMREGEICALRWRNVDLAARTVAVREAVGKEGGRYYLKEPKTSASRRVVPIPDSVAEALRARRVDMMEQAMAAGVPFSPDMFALGSIDRDERTGDYRFLNPHVLWERWRALADLMGLVGTQGRPVTFHDLRHTFATSAIAQGADVKSVSSTLGHSNAAMTLNIYADADPEAKRRASEAVAASYERGAAGGVVALRRAAGGE